MPANNGTLRLVAHNPEPVGMGTPATDAAFASFKTELDKLGTLVGQLSNTALSNQLVSVMSTFDAYKSAVDAAMANLIPPAPAPGPAPSGTVDLATFQVAEQTIQQLQMELAKLGYTFSPTNQTGTPPAGGLTRTVTPGAEPVTYTVGQVGAVAVGSALAGWLGHSLWDDYGHKRGRAR